MGMEFAALEEAVLEAEMRWKRGELDWPSDGLTARRTWFYDYPAWPARVRRREGRYRAPGRPSMWTDEKLAALIEMAAQGKTLQEMGDHFGVTREYVRSTLARYPGIDPPRVVRLEAARARRAAEAEAAAAARRAAMTETCVICGAAVLAGAVTCGGACAEAWRLNRHRLSDDEYEKHRAAMARSILRHPENHPASAPEWAVRYLADPEATRPDRRYQLDGTLAADALAAAGVTLDEARAHYAARYATNGL